LRAETNPEKDLQASGFHVPGKLLITGEYLVLEGAEALAVPTRLGQFLNVSDGDSGTIHWRAELSDGSVWFEASFKGPAMEIVDSTDRSVSERLSKVLAVAHSLSDRPESMFGSQIVSRLEFPRDWGLGSSSTLIALVSHWTGADAFQLSEQTFGGSGYDVAVALHGHSMVYSRTAESWNISPVEWRPDFSDNIHFVHLGKKMDSRRAIKGFESGRIQTVDLQRMSDMTEAILKADDLREFEALILQHETLISRFLEAPSSKDMFPDAPGATKFLGAWGGDHLLATGPEDAVYSYFASKGYTTITSFEEMISP